MKYELHRGCLSFYTLSKTQSKEVKDERGIQDLRGVENSNSPLNNIFLCIKKFINKTYSLVNRDKVKKTAMIMQLITL